MIQWTLSAQLAVLIFIFVTIILPSFVAIVILGDDYLIEL